MAALIFLELIFMRVAGESGILETRGSVMRAEMCVKLVEHLKNESAKDIKIGVLTKLLNLCLDGE